MPYILPDITESADAAASTATSYSLGIGQTAHGTIASLGDHDWYSVNLVAGQTYTFAMVGTGTSGVRDSYLQIYGPGGSNIGVLNDDGLPNNNSVVTYTAASSGTYYIDAGAFNNAGTGQYGVSVAAGTRAVADIEMAAGIIDAYTATGNNEYSWSATPGTGATVTVGFRLTDDGLESNFSQFSAQQMAAVLAILPYYSDVSGLNFNIVNQGGYTDNATILLSNYNFSDNSGGYGQYPGLTAASSQDGNIHINIAGGNSTASLPLGSYSFDTLMHELGHAVGLSHPGLYNAAPGVSITYGSNAQFAQDTHQYTVMSYFDEFNSGASFAGYPETLMLYDIYALQQIYGANMTTRSGNSVYGFNSNVGGVYDFSSNTFPALCIWDGGGTDTLNCSGYSLSELINLNAGAFSNIGGGTANVSIALGVTIENATGGSGNDTIFGNAANNIFNGGGGTDTIDGGAGRDTTIFNVNFSSASIVHNANGSWTITTPGEVETLTNVEIAQFSDRLFSLGAPVRNDFSGDGLSDILWRNSSTGQVVETQMNGLIGMSGAGLGGDANWSVVGTGDFNGDGMVDILWRNSTTGAIVESEMNGSTVIASAGLGGDTNWSIVGTGDFNGDGRSDILWHYGPSGTVCITEMNGTTVIGSGALGGDASWSIVGTGDFNGDGRSDILWRYSTGSISMTEMNGTTVIGSGGLGGDANWTIVGTGDFNDDGRSDILWRYNPNGAVYGTLMNGATVIGSGALGGNANLSVFGTGDYNGDGMTDILWRNGTTGAITENLMNGFTVTASAGIGGDANWRPVAV